MAAPKTVWVFGILALSVFASLTAPAEAQVTLAHAAGYHAGGGSLGGGHPTAGAYSFTVPQGTGRLLLVLGPSKYDPSIPPKVASQRATLVTFTYAGRPLQSFRRAKSGAAHGTPYVWYLADPPAGNHKFEMIQFHKDNGGENRLAALAFTGVDTKDPFAAPGLTRLVLKGKTIAYHVKCRTGGMVVDSLHYGGRRHTYYRIMPGPGQRLAWENCHDYRYEWMGSTKPGADTVQMRWETAGTQRCAILALSLNPMKDAPVPAPVEPSKAIPKDKLGAETPGLVARVYDLSANPPKPSTRRQNYKTPALGSKIPKIAPEALSTTKVIDKVDLHPNTYRQNPGRLPDKKGVLGSGIRRNFVLEFVGRINIPESGDIMFKLLSVDQAKLLIDGRLVIDNHGHNYNTLKTGIIRLEAGKHAIRLVNVEDTTTFGVSLGWRLPSGHKHGIPRGHKAPIAVVPVSAFTHTDEHMKPDGRAAGEKRRL